MDYVWIAWVIAGIVFAIAEVFTLGFVLLWFGVGAIAASLVALAGFGFPLQVVVFLAVSIVLTIASRTIFDAALLRNRTPALKMGVDSLPGQVGMVTESSKGTLGEGAVKVFGSTWTAFPEEGEDPLEVGERVEVARVEGASIYVRRVGKSTPSWRS